MAKSRIEQVADHLKTRGHISQGSAIVEYGNFRLSDVVHRLRNERKDLLPSGSEIITVTKNDVKGGIYGEYALVQEGAAQTATAIHTARHLEPA